MEKYNFEKVESKWPSSANLPDSKAGATAGRQKIYDFKAIEKKWQGVWAGKENASAVDFDERPKHYHLIEFPYPSGAGLHVGHCMGYGASDAYCRMKRMQGNNVMFPIGWDAFGLPTENYAIKNKIKPQDATAKNVANFIKQMKRLGLSFDWSREINTTNPDYYRWTQWIFLQFYKHAIINPSTDSGQVNKLVEIPNDDTKTPRLAFQAEIAINWCPSCKIGLANEEVIAGKCERCGNEVIKKMQKQWMLRITAYAERLIKDLDNVDYLDKIKTQQVNWIGKSEGANIVFRIHNTDNSIKVFTTRADTLFGCTYLVLSPEHLAIKNYESRIKNYGEVVKYVEQSKKKSDLERTELQKEKTGVKLEGVKAVNPINNEEVDIWVADYVLASYGTGAVMAVPAHDDRDFEFATKYHIPIKQVIEPKNTENSIQNAAFTNYGVLINSDEFNDLTSEEAKEKITEKLKSLDTGDFSINYKLRDWVFSRQHYWGEPIPLIHCGGCGIVPMDEKDLPLALPDVENYEPTNTGESPLASISDWVNVKCPKCGGDAKRETDTMPNWAGSSWYFLRYCDPKNNEEFASEDKLKYWLPIDIYNGGMEHTTLHLLYSRFWHKFLYDLGKVPTSEPYQKRIAHGIILGPDGRKMSKSFGNVINPDDIIKQFGADTTRAYIMFIGPYDQESAWSMAGVQGVYRFLNRIFNNLSKVRKDHTDEKDLLVKLNQTILGISDDLESFHLNTVVSKLMELNNTIEKTGQISLDSYEIFLKLLFPVAPHLASELWEMSEQNTAIDTEQWPEVDPKYLVADKIEIAVQINGKVRDRVMVEANISDDDLKQTVLELDKVKQNLEGKEIVKVIIVPKKLVSIVVR